MNSLSLLDFKIVISVQNIQVFYTVYVHNSAKMDLMLQFACKDSSVTFLYDFRYLLIVCHVALKD